MIDAIRSLRLSFVLVLVIFIVPCLSSCVSTQQIISNGKISVGMERWELRSALLLTTISEDPFLSGCYRRYFSDIHVEILSSKSQVTFYVFENVSLPSNGCSQAGNGKLLGWSATYEEAIALGHSKLSNKEEAVKRESPKQNEGKNCHVDEDGYLICNKVEFQKSNFN